VLDIHSCWAADCDTDHYRGINEFKRGYQPKSSLVKGERGDLFVLRRIFGPKRDGVAGGWRKLHDEELKDLCFSPSIIRISVSRRMRCVGHMA
jgi:hypothetical protein